LHGKLALHEVVKMREAWDQAHLARRSRLVYTLETHAMISSLDDDPTVVPLLEPLVGQDSAIVVSVMTALELLSHPELPEEDITAMTQLLTSVVSFPLESRLAHLAGALRLVDLAIPNLVVTNTGLRLASVRQNLRIPGITKTIWAQ
jgi:hypothetical protein